MTKTNVKLDEVIDLSIKTNSRLSDAIQQGTTQVFKNRIRQSLTDTLHELPAKICLSSDNIQQLMTLDPYLHSEVLAYLIGGVLSFYEDSANVTSFWVDFLPLLYRFATESHPDCINECLKKVTRIAQSIDKIVMAQRKTEHINVMQSTRILCLFISRGNMEHKLTKIHPLALKHAILAKMYRHALPFAHLDPSRVIFGFPLDLSDYILYYYYSGLVFLNLSQFLQASMAFEQVLVVPDRANTGRPSVYQIEAYCKYVLIGLYLTGKPPSLPQPASKNILLCTKRFDDIASYYKDNSLNRFQAAVKAGDGLFQAVNVGLAKRCIRNRVNQIIEKLPNLYMKLSLNDVCDMLKGLKYSSIENLLLDLVERKRIIAEIADYTENGKGMVYLNDAPLEFTADDEAVAFHELHKAIKEVNDLAQLAKTLSRDFIIEYGVETKKSISKSYEGSDFHHSRG